jgi:transcriptional regulator with XRE-family HTH domain
MGSFSIAEKLDQLFRQAREARPREAGSREAEPRDTGRAEPSYMAVAEAIRAQQGVSISHTYIWQLRTGRRDNPTVQHLTALATYFGVPVSYFLDDEQTRRVDAQLDLLRTLRDAGVTEIALRAADVSPRGRETISELIRKVWESEQHEE